MAAGELRRRRTPKSDHSDTDSSIVKSDTGYAARQDDDILSATFQRPGQAQTLLLRAAHDLHELTREHHNKGLAIVLLMPQPHNRVLRLKAVAQKQAYAMPTNIGARASKPLHERLRNTSYPAAATINGGTQDDACRAIATSTSSAATAAKSRKTSIASSSQVMS
jgi:hypothetical protein